MKNKLHSKLFDEKIMSVAPKYFMVLKGKESGLFRAAFSSTGWMDNWTSKRNELIGNVYREADAIRIANELNNYKTVKNISEQ